MLKTPLFSALLLLFFAAAAMAGKHTWAEVDVYNQLYQPKYSNPVGGENPFPRAPTGMNFYSGYLRYPVPLDQELTFDQFMGQVNAQAAAFQLEGKEFKIEDAIDLLPYEMKEQNYVLMYRSRSLQHGSPEAPRAIVYTPTASFILSFNGGDPGVRGAQTIEAIQFKRAENRFEFHEITFDGMKAPDSGKANPKKCIQCHQSPTSAEIDLRPNWDPYNTWIGAYGSDTGHLNTTPLREQWDFKRKILAQDAEALEEQANEYENFKHFVDDIKPNHPRYSRLGKPNLSAPKDLSENLMVWNFLRTMRKIMSLSDIYPLYQETFAWLINCQPSIRQIRTSAALNWHYSFSYPKYFDYSPYSDGKSVSTSTSLTQLFEPLGIDTSDWSMDLGTAGRFAFYERFGTPSDTARHLQYAWGSVDPDSNALDDRSCEDLKAAGIAKIDRAFKLGLQERIRAAHLKPKPTAQEIIQRCVACHEVGPGISGGTFIPFIPWQEESDLIDQLRQPATTHPFRTLREEMEYRTSDMAKIDEQMPPLHRLSTDERNTLMKYIKELP